ncbi:MAG TPA: hypothetical protein VHW46_09845 [Terracidiphilus sp.]|jgi:hypothetical protein|nr:hypothetical protein [Terracidiphilus sp.]
MTSTGSSFSRSNAFVTGSRSVNWVEVKEPVKFDFSHGVTLVGILTSIERVQIRDNDTRVPKPAVRYTVLDEETSAPVFFFGTVKLDSMIRTDFIGRYVSITCTGEDKSVQREGRAMKEFEILRSEDFAPGWATDGTRITDSDLPPSDSY